MSRFVIAFLPRSKHFLVCSHNGTLYSHRKEQRPGKGSDEMNRNTRIKIVSARDQPKPHKTLGLSFDLILAGGHI